jgi:nucleoside-diphosphate-sugar epimerase
MRVLILGGTGLISTGITQQLLARGDEVTHLRRGTGGDSFGSQVRTVRGDRADVAALTAAWGAGHDAVIDMLCFTAADAEALIAALGGQGAHYLMCSTVDVYTKPARYMPIDEQHERAPSAAFEYAFGKARAEELLLAAHDRGDLAVTILRPAATYLDAAVPSVGSFDLAVERLLAGLPVILHGDGSGLWAACHRDDVAAAFVRAAATPDVAGRCYNVTGYELLTWEQYWADVAEALGVRPTFLHIPTDVLAAGAPRMAAWCLYNFQYDNVFDCSAAARDLGFRCITTWPKGIAAGLPGRVPQPVDSAERAGYEAIVGAWQRAVAGLQTELAALDL